MKVVAFNGSPRKKGNTFQAIEMVFDVLEKEGIQTEIVQVGGMKIGPCKACNLCRKEKDGFCHGYEKDKEDILNDCMSKMYEAQGVIIGSPAYFGSVTPETKALIDRSGYSSRGGSESLLKRKVCAGIAVVRRQGASTVLDQINSLFSLCEAVVCHSRYWNMIIGRKIGEILKDEEGIKTLKKLGENMSWLLKKINN